MPTIKDPAGTVPLKERYTLDALTGTVVLLENYREFYQKAFARAGMNLALYLRDEKTFIAGLRVLNQAKMDASEAGEAEHLARLDKTTRAYLEAVDAGDTQETERLRAIIERRKAFRTV